MTTVDSSTTFGTIGRGIAVFEDTELVEGTTVWLDTPDAVMDFVERDDVENCIVIARGGTTTFLTPALVAGPRGVLTLQGAPTSHLGIVSREYGIPCIMSVAFSVGETNARGEVVPADGTVVRLDITGAPVGRVLAQNARGAEEVPHAADDEPDAVLVPVDTRGVPGGTAGHEIMLGKMSTGVLNLTDESLIRELTNEEANDLLDYYGWNLWDILAARISEGESGLIPRQEYEVMGTYLQWQHHPRFHRMITDAVGVDGLREIGGRIRNEVGTKLNPLHIWAAGVPSALGRSIALDLGHEKPGDRTEDLKGAMQFTRRLYRGMWNDQGPMFLSGRGYHAPLLGSEWVDRFIADRTPLAKDPQARKDFQRFNGSTQLASFLLHFDCRNGVADTGPYPLPGGGWALVRDHVLNDPGYPWADAVRDLPWSVTLVLFFEGEQQISSSVVDIGTMFTTPSNYLKHLTGYAVYVRERSDSPVSEIRLLREDELAPLAAKAEKGAAQLYPRIAAMSDREKILAGSYVYYTDFVGTVGKAAGIWDDMLAAGFYDFQDSVDRGYGPIVEEGRAMEMLGRFWSAAEGMDHV
ncbi:PEP-utilizing enzyme [Rhodococcoides kyotonense]|uniref:PEP-utilising enzyme, mobile domain n=1 Tax=Rhodococcoides kyotonense TaxID=398843 RepID=A0A239K372_9NOCA|nr:PEP-utilizing enzyme [Rhodococcus kyotonensis]SNT12767.1 PEP-utilising enzyme, mobile domain [Rhodococcus kyotonensis]